MYGCEVWGIINIDFKPAVTRNNEPKSKFFCDLKNNHPIVSKFFDHNDSIENLHTKFCKYILGVHSKTTNLGVYGDLGRLPLFIDQITSCIKYYYHLEFSTENTLLQEFYSNLKNHEPLLCKRSIVGFAEQIHRRTNISMASNKKSSGHTVKNIQSATQSEFASFWKVSVSTDFSKRNSRSGGNKLRTYRTFKSCIKKENYLNLTDPALRRSFAKLRLSAHRLKIETERFSGKNGYIKPEERICRMCDLNKSEDEHHFLIDCSAYVNLRGHMFTKISKNNLHFNSYTGDDKFIWLMSNENINDLLVTAQFIHQAMSLRT